MAAKCNVIEWEFHILKLKFQISDASLPFHKKSRDTSTLFIVLISHFNGVQNVAIIIIDGVPPQKSLKAHVRCVRLLVHRPVRTVTKSNRLLVRLGSDLSIVSPGHNHLLGTEPFLTWFAAELSNIVGPQRGTRTAPPVCLLRTGPKSEPK
jgi:hypothetical protein